MRCGVFAYELAALLRDLINSQCLNIFWGEKKEKNIYWHGCICYHQVPSRINHFGAASLHEGVCPVIFHISSFPRVMNIKMASKCVSLSDL